VRWYLRYSRSYRDLEEMMAERGLSIDHVTIWRCFALNLRGMVSLTFPLAEGLLTHTPGFFPSAARYITNRLGPPGSVFEPASPATVPKACKATSKRLLAPDFRNR
jgi:hypothetical protein